MAPHSAQSGTSWFCRVLQKQAASSLAILRTSISYDCCVLPLMTSYLRCLQPLTAKLILSPVLCSAAEVRCFEISYQN